MTGRVDAKALRPFGRLGLRPCLDLTQPRQPVGLAGQRLGQLVPTGVAEQPNLALVGRGGAMLAIEGLKVEPVDCVEQARWPSGSQSRTSGQEGLGAIAEQDV